MFPDKADEEGYVEHLSMRQDLACLIEIAMHAFVSRGSILPFPMDTAAQKAGQF
jgi:hypothetical protein